jgi:hypothetical protein
MPITISNTGGVRSRALDLLLAVRRHEPQKAADMLRELVALGFNVENLGLSAADRLMHGRPELRTIRGGKMSDSRSE